jgi:hypothetical protein
MTVGKGGAIVGPKRQALLVSDMAMAEDAPNGQAGQRIHDASRLSYEDVQNVVHGYADLTGILHMTSSQPKKCASDRYHMQSICI